MLCWWQRPTIRVAPVGNMTTGVFVLRRNVFLLLLSTWFVASIAGYVRAEPGHAGVDPAEVARWPVETITFKEEDWLTGKKTIGGLILYMDDDRIEFMRLRREPGKPMGRVFRNVNRDQVESIKRLDAGGRARLASRLSAFAKRIEIQEGLLEDVTLVEGEFEGLSCSEYEGPWFTLLSRADQATTKLAVVRLEQVFAGIRAYLPPELERDRPQRIVILGNESEYRRILDLRGFDVRQRAFFDPKRNEIVAGGGLASFAAQLREVQAHHETLKTEYRQRRAAADKQVAELAEKLRQKGNTRREIRAAVRAVRAQLNAERDELRSQIDVAARKNDAIFQQMFRHLYHEAFHAYLSNFVVVNATDRVPRWLNEGWAQVFEAGLLEAGSLRVDAPSPERLRRLQLELESANPLSLREVLLAPDARFNVGHNQSAKDSSRLYLYSWGLAYHLTFHRQLLGSSAMERYISQVANGRGSLSEAKKLERFEKLVGTPLEEFEQRWHAAMLDLARRRR